MEHKELLMEIKNENKTYKLNIDKIQTLDDIRNVLSVLGISYTTAIWPSSANPDLWIEVNNESKESK